jgi:soluble lytic murein transglycosylase-like protein
VRFAGKSAAIMGLGALVSAHPAPADVLEIDHLGHRWVAGGPVESASPANRPVDELVPVELHFAQPALTSVESSAGPANWRAHVARLAQKYDISPALLEAVVWQESRWNASARSPAGARGLAQLMPGTARMMGVNPDDPHANLEGGARYLRMQLNAFDGDLEKALAAYNAGPARVIEADGIPAIRETRNYVASVLGRLSHPVREPGP